MSTKYWWLRAAEQNYTKPFSYGIKQLVPHAVSEEPLNYICAIYREDDGGVPSIDVAFRHRMYDAMSAQENENDILLRPND